MSLTFDLVVLGGGSAGYAAARTFQNLGGGTVAVVDSAAELGGLCILRGCMPSKTLLASAELLHRTREAAAFGLVIDGARPDLDLLRARKQRLIQDDFAAFRQGQLTDGRFTLLRHRGRLVDSHTLELDDGRTVRFRFLMIATGSVIASRPIPGLAQTPHWTSDDVLDLPELPESVIVLGGGIVACELAQYLSRMGARTTLVQRSERILRENTPEAAAALTAAFRAEGMEVFTGTTITGIAGDANGVLVRFSQDGTHHESRAARLFQALGRKPATTDLGLEAVGIATRKSGHIVADALQRTTQSHIFAAGDCAGPLEIVHVAIQQAEVAVHTMLGRPTRPVDYDRQLTVVFTDPGIAFCGRREEDLRAAGVDFVSAEYPFADLGKALLLEAPHGYAKLWAERTTGRLLAAECVGRDAGELIHSMAVAIALDHTAADLLRVPWYHPTLSEIWTYPLEDLAGETD